MGKQIGYAVVGAGPVVERALLPAFARAGGDARLAAIVSSDRARGQALAHEHHATAYHLDEFRQCLQRDDVHAVYIALPNSQHCDYAVEAARAGAHVLVERPMAVMADECRRMLRTCQTNRVKLMVAYHLQFHPGHLRLAELVRSGAVGAPKTISSDFTVRVQDQDDMRLQRRLGGGTVYDLGVYCINAARMFFEAEPAQVMAMTARASRRLGGDVDEGTVALIRFPDERLAHFHTSFGEAPMSVLTLLGDEGYIRLTNAYLYDTPMQMDVVRRGQHEELTFEPTDQFAGELVYFADCVLNDRPPEPSGLEGLQDVRIVEAIYRSARDGRPVTLPRIARADAPPTAEQEMRKPVADRRQAG
jgi:predicted dehydrogenase